MPEPARSALADITAALARARRIAVLTGAGMSAESGIPTFRGARNGLWERFEPERLATPEAFDEDNALVWGWYRWRTALVEKAQPHAGHLALAALEKCGKEIAVVGTSGVVFPAADLPRLVKRRGQPVLEIDPVASAITPIADIHWPVSAAPGLAQVVAALTGGAGDAGDTMAQPQRDDSL